MKGRRSNRLAYMLIPFLVVGAVVQPGFGAAMSVPVSPGNSQFAVEDTLPLRPDPDGGFTLNLHIDDGIGGSYTYTDAIQPVPEDVPRLAGARAAGVFVHQWTEPASGAPMSTVGVYYDLAGEAFGASTDKRLRVPMLLFENVPVSADALLKEAAKEASLIDQALPMLANLVMPDFLGDDETAFPPGGSAYQDFPTMYVWTARKATPVTTAWSGFYAARTGSQTPGIQAEHRIEIGAAARANDQTQRLSGLYLENKAARSTAGTTMHMGSTYTAGAATPAGDVPMTQAVLTEDRSGPHYLDHAEKHGDELQIGVRAGETFIPLVGVRTTQMISYGSDVTNLGATVESQEAHRTTDMGVYAASGSSFVPLVGYHYDGERWSQDRWIYRHVENGGPGDQDSGDWLASVGVYAAGNWAPLAGAQYDDDFAEHHYAYRSTYTAGVFLLDQYQKTAGVTYDGELALVPWALHTSFAEDPSYRKWEVAAGGFALGRFVPVAGAQFGPGRPYGRRVHQWHLYAGVYPGDYQTFLPLLWAGYDGDHSTGNWAVLLAFKHVFGTPSVEGSVEVTGGVTPAGLFFVPLAEAQYRPESPAVNAQTPWESYVIIGVYHPDASDPATSHTFVPLVGVTVANHVPLFDVAFGAQGRIDVEVALLQPSYRPVACASVGAPGPSAAVEPCAAG